MLLKMSFLRNGRNRMSMRRSQRLRGQRSIRRKTKIGRERRKRENRKRGKMMKMSTGRLDTRVRTKRRG